MRGETVRGTSTQTALPVARLTPAEMRVFERITQGHSNREIAADLVLTEATVRSHLTRIYAKLEVRSRADLLARLAVSHPRHADDAAPAPPEDGASRAPAPRVVVLGAAAILAAVLAIALPITVLVAGPSLLIAAVVLLRPSGTASRGLRGVLIGAAALLCVGALVVGAILLAVVASG